VETGRTERDQVGPEGGRPKELVTELWKFPGLERFTWIWVGSGFGLEGIPLELLKIKHGKGFNR